MTRCKVLLSVAFLCTYSWLSNTAQAEENCETTTTSSQEDGYYSESTTTECSYSYESTEREWYFSPDNPFATSEYEDIAIIAEAWLQLGGNIDDYFYSEGFTTGTDGDVGNEHLCIRDDANKIYFGRSDICANRKMADYEYIHFDQVNPDGFDSLAQLRNSMLDPDQIYKTGDLLGNTSQYWDGCYSIDQGWGGTSGGSCPTINDKNGGQINFGYVNKTLTNTAAIDQALKGVGLETTGYTYIWRIKNLDANYREQGNGRTTADPLEVTVKIYDNNGNSVYEKSYDYSYYMDWTRFMGTETFDEPFNLDEISELQLSVTGYDLGYWAGYYGPEFREPNINLLYRVAEPTGPSPEEILKEQMCTNDPTYDISCPGYNDAMIAQITMSSSMADPVEEIASVLPAQTGSDDGSNTGTETLSQPEPQQNTGVQEETQPEQVVAQEQPTSDPVEEQMAEEASSNPTSSEEKKSTGLSATQLAALDIAENATSAAQSSAASASQQSAGIGLSASGGISSELTSDGISNANGTLNSSVASIVSGSNSGSSNGSTNQSMGSNGQTGSSFGDPAVDLASIESNLQSNSMNTQTDIQIGSADIQNNNLSMSDNIGQTDMSMELNTNGLDLSTEINTNSDTGSQDNTFEMAALDVDNLSQLDINNPIIDDIINGVTNNLIESAVKAAEEIVEESSETAEEQNAKEDELVEQALSGDDSEDAQAALLGYNPEFRAYQTPQLPDNQFYQPKDIYDTQENYDNPNQRFFSGASDATHREMVRQQYER